MTRLLLAASVAFTFAAVPLGTSGALAAGSPSSSKIKCGKGRVPDRSGKKCVRVKSSLDDDTLIEGARDLAYGGRYDEALQALDLVRDQDDVRVLGYRGFATRKSGRMEEGLGYYRAALKADPDYTLVREYMGEAFLEMGDVPAAEEQLAEIERRCGKECREYALLSSAIKTHKLLNPGS